MLNFRNVAKTAGQELLGASGWATKCTNSFYYYLAERQIQCVCLCAICLSHTQHKSAAKLARKFFNLNSF